MSGRPKDFFEDERRRPKLAKGSIMKMLMSNTRLRYNKKKLRLYFFNVIECALRANAAKIITWHTLTASYDLREFSLTRLLKRP